VGVVKQLPWARLEMSARLKAADPASIGRIAAGLLGAADALQRHASELEARAGWLRQPGSWFSPAATVFVNAADEQSGGVAQISELVQRLGQALNALATDLGSARADALAAVVRSAWLDDDISELNARVSLQQASMPLISAAPPGAEADAAVIQAAQRSASSDLWFAEHRATAAWAHAGAAFDFVSNGTPAGVKKWKSSGWDPINNVSLAASAALACKPMESFGLPTNGVLTGPDGQKYPLDIPTTTNIDGRAVIPSRDFAGEDAGWKMVGIRDGYTSFGYKSSGWDQAEIIVGAAAGASYTEGSDFDKGRLQDVLVRTDGGAYLIDPKDMEGGSVKEATGAPERTAQEEVWLARPAGIAGGRKAATPDGIGLFDNGLAGVALAMHLNDSRAARYRVVFQEDAEGNRRARMLLYRVADKPGQPEYVDIEAAYVDKNGHLAAIPITGEDAHATAFAH
jgi:hypothetical protein